jgi:hypothetical protein
MQVCKNGRTKPIYRSFQSFLRYPSTILVSVYRFAPITAKKSQKLATSFK